MTEKNLRIITLIVILLIAGFIAKADFHYEKAPLTHTTNTDQAYDSSDYIDIPVNQPMAFGGMTKAQIYDIRKEAVNKSIFKDPNYKPSEEVFGELEDYKPWISQKMCTTLAGVSDIEGPSEESRFVLNPTALVALDYPYSPECDVPYAPPAITIESIKYSKNKNEIIVTYDRLVNNTSGSCYDFKGLNARDLGYRYAYIDKEKSTFPLIFIDKENNMGNNVVEYQDFLHTGGSCGIDGGCNNGSPHQPMIEFKNPHFISTSVGPSKEIYIKLWKEKPASKHQKPDIVERIIISHT